MYIHPRTNILSHCAMSLTGLILCSSLALAEEVTPVIQVQGTALESADSVTIKTTEQDYIPADAAEVLKSVPGANLNKNGPLTGIAQYRGMFGPRINTQLDGLNIAPAGPNWMDPPLSHIPTSQLENIAVIRGISPVSAGAESIGGTIRATTAKLSYTADGTVKPLGSISTGYESNNNAYTVGGQVGGSSGSDRFQLNGNYDNGQDMKAGNGKDIVPTQYKRRVFGADYGHRFDAGEFSLGYSNERVDNAGSPALPMDITYVKGNTFSTGFKSLAGSSGIQWLADLHYMDTEHKMDNYTQRSAPVMLGVAGTPLMQRYALTNAKDLAYKLHAAIPLADGTLTLGTDGWMATHNADVFYPASTTFS